MYCTSYVTVYPKKNQCIKSSVWGDKREKCGFTWQVNNTTCVRGWFSSCCRPWENYRNVWTDPTAGMFPELWGTKTNTQFYAARLHSKQHSKLSLVIHGTKSPAAEAWCHRAGEWQASMCRDQSPQRTGRGQTQLLCITFYWAKRAIAAAHNLSI